MRLPLYSAAAIAVLAVAGVVALNTLNRGPGVGSGPTSSPASQPTVGPTPTSAIPSGLLDDGWDPEGPDQVIEYSRNRMGVVPPSVWARIEGPRGENSGGPIGGGGGCTGGIGYPWVLKVGPADADPSTYRPILDSGGITHGTITIWIDVAPDGTVTAGKGRPEWATMEAPSNCGA